MLPQIDSLEVWIRDGRSATAWHRISFDAGIDEALTGGDFHGRDRYLRFEARIPIGALKGYPVPAGLYVYLGRDLFRWDDKLAIPLGEHQVLHAEGVHRYLSAERPNRRLGEKHKTPALEFKNNYWTTGKAALTICADDQAPITRTDGSRYQTSMRLGYSDEPYERMYASIRHDVQHAGSAAKLGAPVRDVLAAARGTRPGSPVLSLYERLERHLPEIERCLRAIAAAPMSGLALQARSYSLEPHQARHALGAIGQAVTGMQVVSVRQTPWGPLPTQFIAQVPIHTQNTIANRFARAALDQVLFWLADIGCELDSYIGVMDNRLANLKADGKGTPYGPDGKFSQAVFDARSTSIHVRQTWADRKDHLEARTNLRVKQNELHAIAAALPHVQHGADALAETATLLFEPRYAQLRHAIHRFAGDLHTPEAPGGESLVETDIEPFQELFEQWMLQRTIEAVQDLGFVPVNTGTGGYDRLPLYLNPTPGLEAEYRHPDHPGSRLVVCYGKVYSTFSAGTGKAYGVEDRLHMTPAKRRKDAPDVAIEYLPVGENVPDILVFDASLSATPSAVSEKGTYNDTLRAFYETENKGRRTLSRSIVLGSYCVAPIPEDDRMADPAQFDPHAFAQSESGALLLPPNRAEAKKRLADVISEVFTEYEVW